MKQFLSFVIKETRHILRDKRTMLILFGMPVAMMLIFGFAITTDVKNVRTVIVTSSMDHLTQQAVDRLAASEYFTITAAVATPKEAELLIRNQKADMAIVFAQDFGAKMGESKHPMSVSKRKPLVQFIIDGTDPNMAQQWTTYATGVLTNTSGGLVNLKMLYNPQMKSAYNFVPAIMGMLLMLVCAIMTSISIVREKERGTMEVLLVSPVKPLMVVVAKVVPYMVLAFIILTLRDTPSSVGLPELPDTKTELDGDDSGEGYRKFLLKKVFGNPVVWVVAVTALTLYIVRFAVLDWGPKFLQQGEQQLSPQLAGWTIGIFEIAGCLGMLSAGWITDHLFKSKGQRVCVIEMVLTGLCLLAIHLLPDGTSPVVMLVLLALAGFFLYGPQALFVVITGNQVTKKVASAAAGFVGLFSYLSTLFTGAGVGLLSDRFGDAFWNNLFLIMACIAVAGGLLIASIWNIKDDGYIHER